MNERIRELAEQAIIYIEPNSDHDGTWVFDKDKFAELIVRECVAICKDIDGEDYIDAWPDRQDCAVEILEHFGVEE